MATENGELRRVAWAEAFPFVRLFSTFRHAIAFWPLVLGTLSVFTVYVSGRVLDRVWLAADGGAFARDSVLETEIAEYSRRDYAAYQNWVRQARVGFERWSESQAQVAEDWEEERAQALAMIDERLARRLDSLRSERSELGSANDDRRAEIDENIVQLKRCADVLRFHLHGMPGKLLEAPPQMDRALTLLFAAEGAPADEQTNALATLSGALNNVRDRVNPRIAKPVGPFILTLNHLQASFAASIQGAASGRVGFSGDAFSREPAMVGSIQSAAGGAMWLVTQRPLFALVMTVILLLNFAFFGGAISRYVAVRACRDELISFSAATGFACRKWTSMVSAPALLVAGIAFIMLLMLIGGWIGAVPGLQVLSGLLFPLTTIGGIVAALALLLLVVALPLMWPPIAVESSDAFHGIQSSAGYVIERPWHYAFYSVVLLVYGAFCFVIVRFLALLGFKLAHAGTAAGMNVSTSAETATVGKLNAMWHMPAWNELSLLPTIAATPFWGDFFNAPLSGAELFAAFLIAVTVFVVVAVVGGFVVSFYFAGATQIYLLLRRDVDSVDYDEIYFEEYEDDFDLDVETPADDSKSEHSEGVEGGEEEKS